MIHLLDSTADYPTREMARLVAGENAVTIGPRGMLRGVVAGARFLRERGGAVHAWGNRAMVAAALAGNRPLIYTPPPEMNTPAWKWMAWIAKRRDASVVCATEGIRNALCRTGVAPDRCRLIRPAAAGVPRMEPALREEVGFRENDFVVLAPGESTRAAEHNLVLWATAIAHELDPTWKVLVWGRGPLAGQVARMGKRLNHPELLYFGRRWEFSQLIRGADIALVAERGEPGLATAMCMAEGLPVVRTVDRVPARIARRMIAVRNDSERRGAMGREGKAEAERLFGEERFLELDRELYAQVGANCADGPSPQPSPRVVGEGGIPADEIVVTRPGF